MGENNILLMSRGIIKDKDDPQTYILGILTVFKLGFNDMAFSLPPQYHSPATTFVSHLPAIHTRSFPYFGGKDLKDFCKKCLHSMQHLL